MTPAEIKAALDKLDNVVSSLEKILRGDDLHKFANEGERQ